MIKEFLLVGAGGALGSMLRHGGNIFIGNKPPDSYRGLYATFSINIIGSFIIGIVLGYYLKNEGSDNWKLFLATGICGGFTTFSAFSFENLSLLQNGKVVTALLYIASSVLLGIAAAWFGYKITN